LIDFSNIGLILVILGFILAFIAVILMAVRRGTPGQTKSAGLVLIGPIPIIFGSDKESVRVLLVLAVVVIAIFLFFMLLPTLLSGRWGI